MITETRDYTVNIAGRLEVDGKSIAIGQISGHVLVVLDECFVPPGSMATLIVTVDGREKVYPIMLPHGIDGQRENIEFF